VPLRSSSIRWGVRCLAWTGGAAAVLVPRLHERLGISRPTTFATAWLAVPAVAIGLPPGRGRTYAVFLAQMWGYLRSFELTYREPDQLVRRLRVDYPIALDRVLGLGRTPTERLQEWRRRTRSTDLLDRALGLVYFGWLVQRQAALGWLAARHPAAVPRTAATVAATFDLGWVLYSTFPTAPPWWAAKHGRLPGVHRVTVDASRKLPLVPEESEQDDEQGNPWASMPSTHTASAAALALSLAEVDPRAGALGFSYLVLLAVALVYLGEHYVADVLAGLALAASVHASAPLVRGPAQRLADTVDRVCMIAWPRRSRPRWIRVLSRGRS
jgi:membrane-associated phospholipid phosphatase